MDSFSLSTTTLLCEEDSSSLSDSNHLGSSHFDCDASDDDEYIQILVQKEGDFGPNAVGFCGENSWLKDARLDSISWVLHTRAVFGFSHHTAYLAVTYLDLFLSLRSIQYRIFLVTVRKLTKAAVEGKVWAMRLLTVACLSLAAKMEESKVPPLSNYPIQDYIFNYKIIQKMELLVFSTFNWKLRFITPFSFTNYFINRLGNGINIGFQELIPKVIGLISAAMKEIILIDQRPSIIAVAAVLAAISSKFSRKSLQMKINSLTLWSSSINDHIFAYYDVMKKIEMSNANTPKSVILPILNPFEMKQNSTIGSTRKRLRFNDIDQDSLYKKICLN